MISERHKFIFLHVPKTGGNAIQTALLPHSDEQKVIHSGQDGKDRFNISGPVTPHKHATLADYHERLNQRLREFHVAIAIRHPFERAVSLYFNPRRWQNREPGIDEAEFVECMKGMTPLVGFLRLDDTIRMPDTILRFTHLEADLEALHMKLNLPGKPPQLQQLNRSKTQPDFRRSLLNSDSLRKTADEIFADDVAFLKGIPEGLEILHPQKA